MRRDATRYEKEWPNMRRDATRYEKEWPNMRRDDRTLGILIHLAVS